MPNDNQDAARNAMGLETDDSESPIIGYLRGLSDRIFNWSDDDHKQAADYAQQRADELRQSEQGPRLAKVDLSGHIRELERTAEYHRKMIKGSKQPSQ